MQGKEIYFCRQCPIYPIENATLEVESKFQRRDWFAPILFCANLCAVRRLRDYASVIDNRAPQRNAKIKISSA
jgi:hypothetical protein